MRLVRKIIEIDESQCDGCGQCVSACHEGAIQLVQGKARLVKDDFCDGLGACLGECPRGALRIIEREAEGFDATVTVSAGGHHACPGSALRTLSPAAPAGPLPNQASGQQALSSQLGQWPVQLMLVPAHAPYLQGADLVVCADCVPFAIPDFHARYLRGRAVVVGCPKLDDLDHYAKKLEAIVMQAQPRRLTVLRMEVPCCQGIAEVAIRAARGSQSSFPVEEHIIGIQGGIRQRVVREASAPARPIEED